MPTEEPPVEPVPPRSPTPPINQTSLVIDELPAPVRSESRQCSNAPSVSSSMTVIRPSIRVEINGRTEQSSILTARHRKQSISPTREQLSRKR